MIGVLAYAVICLNPDITVPYCLAIGNSTRRYVKVSAKGCSFQRRKSYRLGIGGRIWFSLEQGVGVLPSNVVQFCKHGSIFTSLMNSCSWNYWGVESILDHTTRFPFVQQSLWRHHVQLILISKFSLRWHMASRGLVLKCSAHRRKRSILLADLQFIWASYAGSGWAHITR